MHSDSALLLLEFSLFKIFSYVLRESRARMFIAGSPEKSDMPVCPPVGKYYPAPHIIQSMKYCSNVKKTIGYPQGV